MAVFERVKYFSIIDSPSNYVMTKYSLEDRAKIKANRLSAFREFRKFKDLNLDEAGRAIAVLQGKCEDCGKSFLSKGPFRPTPHYVWCVRRDHRAVDWS